MRAVHLVGPHTTGGLQPLCGNWESMDSDWTYVSSEVTCAACTTAIRLLASEAAPASAAALRVPPG